LAACHDIFLESSVAMTQAEAAMSRTDAARTTPTMVDSPGRTETTAE
jgi:hypothetical protein